MQAISDNLIHFLARQWKGSPVKQLEVFKSIIKDGLKFRNTQIKFGNQGAVNNHIVCLTDIPLSLCDKHAANYGKFGIGFKKSSIKRCGGNPVRYFIDYDPVDPVAQEKFDNRGAMYSNLSAHFGFLLRLRTALGDGTLSPFDSNGVFSREELNDWVDKQLTILSFEKETGDLGPARDESEETDTFYKEREWRLVPLRGNRDAGFVVHDVNRDEYSYRFNRQDVNVVVTPDDDTRTEVLRFLLLLEQEDDQRMKDFGKNPPPVITYDDLHKW